VRGIAALTWQLSRFELASLLILLVGLIVAATYLSIELSSSTPQAACLPLLNGAPIKASDANACPGLLAFLDLNSWVERVQMLMAATLLLGCALLGSQVVAKELDHGTVQLAWSLTGVRSGWLALRLIPVALLLLPLGIAVVLASTALEHARHPGLDPSQSFMEYGFWGPILVFRAFAVLLIGVLIGAVVARAAPSLLLTAAFTAATVVVLPISERAFQPTLIASVITSPANAFPLFLDSGWLTPNGQFLSNAEAVALAPAGGPPGSAYDWIAGHFQSATSYLPGDRLVAVTLQEAVIDTAIGLAALGTTLVVIRRRRAN
jgi:hypothetical protein